MGKHKGKKIVTMRGVLRLWKVRLPDGRSAELMAKSRKKAMEQAAMLWGIPLAWMLEKASAAPVN